MKKILAMLVTLMLLCAASCGKSDETSVESGRQKRTDIVSSADDVSKKGSENISDSTSENSVEISQSVSEQTDNSDAEENESSKILIAYFSLGENIGLSEDVDADASVSITTVNGNVSGNTGVIADYIRQATGGDTFSIITEYYYPENYDETVDLGQEEQSENVRPKLVSHIENFEEYDTVFVGYPNWWFDMPMAMYSFFDEYDFSGKTIIPFVTSGGSGFSETENTIRQLEPEANVLDGLAVYYTDVEGAQSEVDDWIKGLDL
ncbi:MAG: flavodoxin [Ruminococcus sp.]|nr:flavodoxin [Ruminococcus sp.]